MVKNSIQKDKMIQQKKLGRRVQISTDCCGCRRGCRVFPWPEKSVHCSGSNWRSGNNTEDTIQMLQVWSSGGKGMKGSQDCLYLVYGRGKTIVRWHWDSGTPVERWKDKSRADISDTEKRSIYTGKEVGAWGKQNKRRQQGLVWGVRTYPGAGRLRCTAEREGWQQWGRTKSQCVCDEILKQQSYRQDIFLLLTAVLFLSSKSLGVQLHPWAWTHSQITGSNTVNVRHISASQHRDMETLEPFLGKSMLYKPMCRANRATCYRFYCCSSWVRSWPSCCLPWLHGKGKLNSQVGACGARALHAPLSSYLISCQ